MCLHRTNGIHLHLNSQCATQTQHNHQMRMCAIEIVVNVPLSLPLGHCHKMNKNGNAIVVHFSSMVSTVRCPCGTIASHSLFAPIEWVSSERRTSDKIAMRCRRLLASREHISFICSCFSIEFMWMANMICRNDICSSAIAYTHSYTQAQMLVYISSSFHFYVLSRVQQ